jgi:hypothetical protein
VLQCEAKGEKPIGVLWNKDNKRLDANVDPRFFVTLVTLRHRNEFPAQKRVLRLPLDTEMN